MASNHFDKYDEPKENHFDKFDNGAPSPTGMDRARAAATGVNRGFYADLLGLPVDAAANVLDLGKAGIGYATSKVTGKAPPEWTMPYDRATVPGTAEWIASQVRKGSNAIGLPSPMDNPNPQENVSRILHSGGRAAGASIIPNPRAAISGAQTAGNMAMGSAAGLVGGTVGEVAPDYAPVASMLPQVGRNAVSSGTKMLVRGGEQGRQNMEQRIQDLQNGGVANPSMGLASGNRLIMGVENLLSKLPGSVGTYQDANAANFRGMQARLDSARDAASPNYGRAATGSAISEQLTSTRPGVNSYPNRVSANYEGLLNNVLHNVGADTPVPVNNTMRTAGLLTTPNTAAPNVSSLSIQPRIDRVFNAFRTDNGGAPAQTVNSPILGANGQPVQTVIPATSPNGIPFGVVRDQRTNIGQEIQSPNVKGTPVEGQYKQLYGAMSADLAQGAMLSDIAAGRMPTAPGSATSQWNRSNNYYSAAEDRAAKFGPVANRQTPEQVYQAYVNGANGNVSTLQAVKKSIDPETRGMAAATLIDEIGAAKAGAQNNAGSVFSPETFLTNYNKMGPGRNELLSGFNNADAVRSGVDDVARAASLLRDGSKIWANPSGTGQNVAASASLGGIAGNLFTHPVAAVGSVAGLLGANQLSSRFLLNPGQVNLAASREAMDPAMVQAMLQRMSMQGLLGDQ